MTDSELVARLRQDYETILDAQMEEIALRQAAEARAEALAAEVQRRDELAAGHPGMCCGVCAQKIAAAEAEVRRMAPVVEAAKAWQRAECDCRATWAGDDDRCNPGCATWKADSALAEAVRAFLFQQASNGPAKLLSEAEK